MEQGGQEPAPLPPQHTVRRTRTGSLWVGVVAFAVVLLLLLIFILQNQDDVLVHFLWIDAHLPLALAMLFAAVGGALLVALAGIARVVQLRVTAKRHRQADAASSRQ